MRGVGFGLLLGALIMALALTASANTHALKRPKPVTQMTTLELYRFQTRALHHYTTAVKWLRVHRQIAGSGREIRWHKAAVKWTRRELGETRRKLVGHPLCGHVPYDVCMVFVNGIHPCEGSWTDSGDPYWGGLQMDRQFMSSYGSDFIRQFGGYANVWPVWAQVTAAYRAYRSGRGFYPWPVCGAPYR